MSIVKSIHALIKLTLITCVFSFLGALIIDMAYIKKYFDTAPLWNINI